ncbi:hypothetical protein C8Q77DRAFT_1152015 [Trametes polyzona]|nr:hypothetical protein C8Q77DRAFT_1152015 [Trametes polyzona]
MSRRLSFFKSSTTSPKLAIDTSAPEPSPITRSPTSAREFSSPISISIPWLSPTRRRGTMQSVSSQSTVSDYAEDMEDDNMAWGKPRKQSKRRN